MGGNKGKQKPTIFGVLAIMGNRKLVTVRVDAVTVYGACDYWAQDGQPLLVTKYCKDRLMGFGYADRVFRDKGQAKTEARVLQRALRQFIKGHNAKYG